VPRSVVWQCPAKHGLIDSLLAAQHVLERITLLAYSFYECDSKNWPVIMGYAEVIPRDPIGAITCGFPTILAKPWLSLPTSRFPDCSWVANKV
jgi:hypothetical protein